MSEIAASVGESRNVGGLLAITDHTGVIGGATSTHFVCYDGNGNIVGLVNAADGTITAQYEYGPFGTLIRATGPMAFVNPFRFSTKYQDDETGLVYYGYRYYSPVVGMWVNRDPIEERGGQNLQGFVGNNLPNTIDTLGQAPMSGGIGGPQMFSPYGLGGSAGPQGSSFSSLEGFARWLVPLGGAKKLPWTTFDADGKTMGSLKNQLLSANRDHILRSVKSGPCGRFTIPARIGYVQDVFYSPIAWISGYQAFTSLQSDVMIVKDCKTCTFIAYLPLVFFADDMSDFNRGGHFNVGPLRVSDDIFIWIRDHTPVGADYRIWARETKTYEIRGRY